MKTNNNIFETIDELLNVFDTNTFIFGGSISDYFIFKKYNINHRINISDIDLIIYDNKIINTLEKYYNKPSILYTSNDMYDEYHLHIKNNTLIDIFIPKITHNIEHSIFNDKTIKHYTLNQRYEILLNTLIYEFNGNKNNGVRSFKHLNKLMIYKHIINEKY